MKDLYFDEVTNIGKLYLDKVLNVFEDEKIIFICIDESNNYYFCLCYEFRESLEWIITPVRKSDLLEVLLHSEDMHSIFKLSNSIIQIICDKYGETSRVVNYEDININYYPNKGVFLKEDIDLTNYLLELNLKDLISIDFEGFVDYNLGEDINSKEEKYFDSFDVNKYTHYLQVEYSLDMRNTVEEIPRICLNEAA